MDRAALDLASIHFPNLEPEPFLDRLNDLASSLGDRLRNFNDGRDFVEKASSYLFGELGFHGNETDFFDPLNSCLNQVLERRTGIPITLAVMYMEIARRLHMPVFGIGLPRHFVLEFNDGNFATYIDPFQRRPHDHGPGMFRAGRGQGGRSDPSAACDTQTDRHADAAKPPRSIPAGGRPRESRHHARSAAHGSAGNRDLVQAARGALAGIETLPRRPAGSAEIPGVRAGSHRIARRSRKQLQAIHLWLAQVS